SQTQTQQAQAEQAQGSRLRYDSWTVYQRYCCLHCHRSTDLNTMQVFKSNRVLRAIGQSEGADCVPRQFTCAKGETEHFHRTISTFAGAARCRSYRQIECKFSSQLNIPTIVEHATKVDVEKIEAEGCAVIKFESCAFETRHKANTKVTALWQIPYVRSTRTTSNGHGRARGIDVECDRNSNCH